MRNMIPILFFLLITVGPPIMKAISEAKKTAKTRKAAAKIERLRELGRDDEANTLALVNGLPISSSYTNVSHATGTDAQPTSQAATPQPAPTSNAPANLSAQRDARMAQIRERKAKRDAEMQRMRELAHNRAVNDANFGSGPGMGSVNPVVGPNAGPYIKPAPASPNVHPAIARIQAAIEQKVRQEKKARPQYVQEETVGLLEGERRERERLRKQQQSTPKKKQQRDHAHQPGEDLRDHQLASFKSTLGPSGYTEEAKVAMHSARDRLGLTGGPASLKRAFILSEVFQKPLAIRGENDDAGF